MSHPPQTPAPPPDDRRCRAPGGRVRGRRVVRGQRPAGGLAGDPRADPGRGARARLAAVGERAGADRGAHARDRARAGARRRATRARRVLRALPVRDRAGADRGRLRAAAPARADRRRGGAAGVRAARGGGARRRLPAHRRRGRRSALRAARGGRRAGRARGRAGRRLPVPVGRDAPRRGDGARGRAPGGARPRADRVPRRAGGVRARAGARGELARGAGRVPGWRSGRSRTRTAKALLREEPTAVVCASDVLALAVLHRRALARPRRPGRRLGDRLRRLAAGGARVAGADVGAGRLRGVRRGRHRGRCWRGSVASRRPTTRRRRRSWWCARRRRGRGSVPRPWRSGSSPARARTRSRASRVRDRIRSTRCGARRSSRAARGRASTCCTSRATERGTRGSPTTSRTGPTSRR